jgi:tRNA pseudouridine32 synthase/23S rRNA pseudouridine746 synthase
MLLNLLLLGTVGVFSYPLSADLKPYPRSGSVVSTHGFIDNAQLGNERLLFLDEDVLVLDKPFYARTVPSQHVKDSIAVNAMVSLGQERVDRMIVHRLDYATSGIVLLARNRGALQSLHAQFRQTGFVRKKYVAIVHGRVNNAEGVVDLPLGKDLDKGPPFCKVDTTRTGKHSSTHWRLLQHCGDLSLLELFPHTGRYTSECNRHYYVAAT